MSTSGELGSTGAANGGGGIGSVVRSPASACSMALAGGSVASLSLASGGQPALGAGFEQGVVRSSAMRHPALVARAQGLALAPRDFPTASSAGGSASAASGGGILLNKAAINAAAAGSAPASGGGGSSLRPSGQQLTQIAAAAACGPPSAGVAAPLHVRAVHNAAVANASALSNGGLRHLEVADVPIDMFDMAGDAMHPHMSHVLLSILISSNGSQPGTCEWCGCSARLVCL